MASDEGLNAYGASTWGQFFIYQGFNEHVGWMHTSSGVDDIDEFLETVTKQGDHYVYQVRRRGAAGQPSASSPCRTRPTTAWRRGRSRSYRTQHGPIVARAERQVDDDRADAGAGEGADAVVHAHQGDRLRVVPADDGAAHQLVEQHDLRGRRRQHRVLPRPTSSRSATRSSTGRSRWTAATRPPTGTGLLSVDETPHLFNPASGWLYNSNNWPWSAAGPEQPEAGGLSGVRRQRHANPRAACTPFACCRTRRTSRSTACSPRRTTAICRGSRSRCPR